MPGDDWACAQGMLRVWPAIPPDHPAEGTCRRLRDALIGLPDAEAGWQDLASLTRQVLLEHAARHGVQVPLRVPGGLPFPSPQQWQDTECSAIPDGSAFSVTARPWHPPIGSGESAQVAREDLQWLAQGPAPLAAAAMPTRSGAPRSATANTILHLGWPTAGGTDGDPCPSGSTTIVCLPTGQGKTEVALAAALLASQDRGVSVLVVPTVVLAFDMERRIRNLLDGQGERQSPTGRYAYTGGLGDADKQAMRQRSSGRAAARLGDISRGARDGSQR